MEQYTNPRAARRRAAQNRRTHNVIIGGLFLLLVVLFFIINLCVKDKTFSESENRSLQQKPELSWSTISDGSYFSDLSTYYSDQFFGRDSWITMQLNELELMGVKDVSGVYLGKSNYLIQEPEEADSVILPATLTAINTFAASHTNINEYLMVVPEASQIMTDYLPNNAPVYDQLSVIREIPNNLDSSIVCLDAITPLQEHADEDIFYHTDHHWTSLGAYYTFMATAAQMGIDTPITDYDVYPVTDSFQGTLSDKSGSHEYSDTIEIYDPVDSNIDYLVNYLDEDVKTCSIYDSSMLEEKDKYQVFFGGNHSILEIRTTANNSRNLLVFKDSYANCYMQFLLPYFEKIIMVDPRYYYDNIETVINSYGITDVLYLYDSDDFLTLSSLKDVLTSSTVETSLVETDNNALAAIAQDGAVNAADTTTDTTADTAAQTTTETTTDTTAATTEETGTGTETDTSAETTTETTSDTDTENTTQ